MSIKVAYGVPGCGKTLLLHDHVRCDPRHLYFVAEHADEWAPESPHWRGEPPRIYLVNGKEELPDPMPKRGVIVCQGWDGRDVAELARSYGPAVYVDDEIDVAAGKSGSWETNAIRELIHRGRHLKNRRGEIVECHILGACRRPQSLHTDFSLASEVYIFRCQGSPTLARLRSDALIEDDEWDVIRNLEKFEFRHYPSGRYFELDPIGDLSEFGEPSSAAADDAEGGEDDHPTKKGQFSEVEG